MFERSLFKDVVSAMLYYGCLVDPIGSLFRAALALLSADNGAIV